MKIAFHMVAILVEIALLVMLVKRVRGAASQLRGAPSDDFLARVGALTDPLMRVAGAELAVFYYAFLGPRIRRTPSANELAYVDGGPLLGLGLLVVMEGISAHFLIHAWSPRVAWIHAALNAYALVWLYAAYQAARLRPVIITEETLLVRTSLLWTIAIPLVVITSVEAIDSRPRGALRASLGTTPNLLIITSAPVEARGLFGIRRATTRIALHVDDADKMREAVASYEAAALALV